MLLENMGMALHAIKANKMRSFLTMLGIIIGIGSVISIVSIGDTMRKMFSDLYKNVGLTLGYVMVAWNVDNWRDSDSFSLDDLEKIRSVFKDEIAYIDSNAYAEAEVTAGRNKERYSFAGIDYNYTDVQPINIIYGRNLNEGDIKGSRPNLVIEDKGALKLFGTANAVGKTMRLAIRGEYMDFNVVGVYQKDQTPLEAMLMNNGSNRQEGFMPYSLITRPNDRFQMFRVYGNDEAKAQDFFNRLTGYVAKLKGRQETEIMVQTAISQMGSVDTMMGGLAGAVGGIAAISLIVGGIGIMNIMLVSVTERTREIGIRKALGARTRDVLIQFLTESAFLSACGGILGVLIGIGLVSIGGMAFGLSVVIKPSVIILAVGFSALVGIFFGLYPASKAAKADPIDALRYE